MPCHEFADVEFMRAQVVGLQQDLISANEKQAMSGGQLDELNAMHARATNRALEEQKQQFEAALKMEREKHAAAIGRVEGERKQVVGKLLAVRHVVSQAAYGSLTMEQANSQIDALFLEHPLPATAEQQAAAPKPL